MCDGKNHNLIEICRTNTMDCDHVVRWCSDCGSVVVDAEFDNRLIPGYFVGMKFPKLAQERNAKKS